MIRDTDFGIWRIFDNFSNELCLAFGIMSIGDSINHFNGLIGHVRIPLMILAESSKTAVGFCFADVADNLVDYVSGIAMASDDVAAASLFTTAVDLRQLRDGDGLLVGIGSLEPQPLTKPLGRHGVCVEQEQC